MKKRLRVAQVMTRRLESYSERGMVPFLDLSVTYMPELAIQTFKDYGKSNFENLGSVEATSVLTSLIRASITRNGSRIAQVGANEIFQRYMTAARDIVPLVGDFRANCYVAATRTLQRHMHPLIIRDIMHLSKRR